MSYNSDFRSKTYGKNLGRVEFNKLFSSEVNWLVSEAIVQLKSALLSRITLIGNWPTEKYYPALKRHNI